MRTINEIIIHHSAFPASNDTQRDFECIVNAHKQRGFNDIGYHFVIGKNGQILKGRSLSLAGAHCKYHNRYSVGVCVLGDFSNGSRPTDYQLIALRYLLYRLMRKFSKINKVSPHSFYSNTLCPGPVLVEFCSHYSTDFFNDLKNV